MRGYIYKTDLKVVGTFAGHLAEYSTTKLSAHGNNVEGNVQFGASVDVFEIEVFVVGEYEIPRAVPLNQSSLEGLG